MSKKFKVGDDVQWNWMGNKIRGTVEEVHFEPITKSIKSKNIKRNGSKEIPAYLVKSEAGNLALKLLTELEPAEKSSGSMNRPKMFR